MDQRGSCTTPPRGPSRAKYATRDRAKFAAPRHALNLVRTSVDSRNHPTLCISGVSVVSVMANFKGKAPLQVRSDASGEELVEEGVECSGRLVLVGELGAAEPEHLIAGQP